MKRQEKKLQHLRELYQVLPEPETGLPAVKQEYRLEMSDGVRLRTVFWRPAGMDVFPVVVTRSCYPEQEAEFEVHAQGFAARGFGFVLQWCRGIHGSEGDWEPNTHERQDGLDTMHWLAARTEVTAIGYWGNSYLASTGWCMADAVPDKVKSMYLGVYGTDRYTSVYQDGLFRQDIFTWWSMSNAGVPVTADYLESCRYRPQIGVDEALWGVRLNWYRDWISNTDRDCEYWSRQGFWRMMQEIPGRLKIPVFVREGWYDHHLGSAVLTWDRLSEQSRACSVFQIGPERHFEDFVLQGQQTEQVKDDRVSSPYFWFAKTLRDGEKPERCCRFYVIGADRWMTMEDLPRSGGRSAVLHLDARQTEHNTGQLRTGAEAEGEVSYIYDPNDPVPSHGAESCFKQIREIGSLYQPECGYRKDVVSFVSGVYEKPLCILGSMEVRLFVSSDAEDTAFTAKVMEMFADGRCVNIRGSITTLAYRNGSAVRQTYEPGRVEEICIVMWPIAWQTHPGSRIRVDISSSDFPQYAAHSNYPGVWSLQEKTKPALQTVYTGERYDSRVILPLYEKE